MRKWAIGVLFFVVFSMFLASCSASDWNEPPEWNKPPEWNQPSTEKVLPSKQEDQVLTPTTDPYTQKVLVIDIGSTCHREYNTGLFNGGWGFADNYTSRDSGEDPRPVIPIGASLKSETVGFSFAYKIDGARDKKTVNIPQPIWSQIQLGFYMCKPKWNYDMHLSDPKKCAYIGKNE
jgi:hypothetical protein